MNILVIDDDLATRKMLRFVLEQQAGHTIWEAADAAEAQGLFTQQRFDLLILDVMMPRVNGFALCQEVRRTSNVPIIIVSGRDSIIDRVRGLRTGADDYLVKPFDAAELAARVEAVLRRARRQVQAESHGRLRLGDLALDLAEHTVTIRRGKPIQLTRTEFRLLSRMARTPGEVCTREQLMECLWGEGDAGRSTLTAYISALRRRLEPDPRHPRYIATVRRAGYRLDC